LLVHEAIADKFLPLIIRDLIDRGVEIRADHKALRIVSTAKRAVTTDWGKEFLSLIMAVRVVENIDEAIGYINTYSSHHSDAIVAEDQRAADRFLQEVDSACVYVNASTRFTDGGQFGLGAEIGISTDRLHARGPMGLTELTTYKYVIRGTGQIRD
jgi:glutamate-5-semialdehyde dehydrogenase